MTDPAAVAAQDWDAIIIGTGVGGATLGHFLASRGLRVLFLEKGSRIRRGGEGHTEISPDTRMTYGWWPHPVSERESAGNLKHFYAAVGCAVGGSSIHYAAALERMAASDFTGLQTSGGTIPPWPVSFGATPRILQLQRRVPAAGRRILGARRVQPWPPGTPPLSGSMHRWFPAVVTGPSISVSKRSI